MPVAGCHCCDYFYGREKAEELPNLILYVVGLKMIEGVKLCLIVYVAYF